MYCTPNVHTNQDCPARNLFIAETLGFLFFTAELAFFTTEHTEEKRRATEYGHCWVTTVQTGDLGED